MATTVRTRIVRIGNSQGIRIPRTILEQLHLSTDVELEIEKEQLIVRRAEQPRRGWDEAFQHMATAGDDQPLADIPNTLTRWDDEEWQW